MISNQQINNKSLKLALIITLIVINEMSLVNSAPLEDKTESDDSGATINKPYKPRTLVDEMNICIDICSECFIEDLNNTEDLENSDSLKCANRCMDNNQPLKTILKWWKNNVFDSKTSECLIDLALNA